MSWMKEKNKKQLFLCKSLQHVSIHSLSVKFLITSTTKTLRKYFPITPMNPSTISSNKYEVLLIANEKWKNILVNLDHVLLK